MNDVVRFMHLFPQFRGASWNEWRRLLTRLTPEILEAFFVLGRSSGKSLIIAMIGLFHATRRYTRAEGEAIVIAIIAPSRAQALVTFRYLRALLRGVPTLAALVIRETADTIWLSTGCVIEVISASAWAPRGRSLGCVIFEEACFFDSDESSANPIGELIRAVRPRLIRGAGARLYFVTSPFAPTGPVYEAERNPRSDVLFVRRPTWEMNPLFDRAVIEREYQHDPVNARSEFGAEWRTDGVGQFLTPAAVEAVTVTGRHELPPVAGRRCHAFTDLSSGVAGDSATLAVAHEEVRRGNRVCVVDLVREVVPPFDVSDVCSEFARTARAYGVELVVGDAFGSEFAASMMRDAGVSLWPTNRSRSELYLELLPAVNARRVELPDLPRLQAQLLGLRRRAGRSGREFVDHPAGQHDDVANAVAGAVFEVLNPVAVAGGTGRAVIDDEQRSPDFPDEIVHARRPSWLEVFGRSSPPRASSRGGER